MYQTEYNLAVGLSQHIISVEVSTGDKIKTGHKNGLWDVLHTMKNHHWRRYFADARAYVKNYSHLPQAKTIKNLIRQCELIQEDNAGEYDDVLTPHPASAKKTNRSTTMYQHTVWRLIFEMRDFYEYIDRGNYRSSISA